MALRSKVHSNPGAGEKSGDITHGTHTTQAMRRCCMRSRVGLASCEEQKPKR